MNAKLQYTLAYRMVRYWAQGYLTVVDMYDLLINLKVSKMAIDNAFYTWHIRNGFTG